MDSRRRRGALTERMVAAASAHGCGGLLQPARTCSCCRPVVLVMGTATASYANSEEYADDDAKRHVCISRAVRCHARRCQSGDECVRVRGPADRSGPLALLFIMCPAARQSLTRCKPACNAQERQGKARQGKARQGIVRALSSRQAAKTSIAIGQSCASTTRTNSSPLLLLLLTLTAEKEIGYCRAATNVIKRERPCLKERHDRRSMVCWPKFREFFRRAKLVFYSWLATLAVQRTHQFTHLARTLPGTARSFSCIAIAHCTQATSRPPAGPGPTFA